MSQLLAIGSTMSKRCARRERDRIVERNSESIKKACATVRTDTVTVN